MQFNTATFLFAFLPLVFVLYYAIPFVRPKNYLLLVASLGFYAWGDPSHVGLLILLICLNYALVLVMDRSVLRVRPKRLLLTLVIVLDVSVLVLYKYTGFFVSNVSKVFDWQLVVPEIALPLGVSYFTLKLVTYAVDVYRGKVPPQTNLVDLALYVAMFPAITAGPVVKYETVYHQLRERVHSLSKVAAGMRLFCVGLAKKVLISNNVALLASEMLAQGGERIGAVGAWTGLIAFSFQLYFDFSGYSDMAIGLARMFGFDLEKNFNYPYISRSVTEFWRRWHVSLSTFFREYIYIPMGGSRVPTSRFIANMATVWLLTGVWHGAAWSYIWWGLYYLAVLLIEKFLISRVLEHLPSVLRHLYVIAVFLFGWCLFWISDLNQLAAYIFALFGAYGLLGEMTYWQIGGWSYYALLLIAAIASTPIVPWLRTNLLKAGSSGKTLFEHADGIGIKDVDTRMLCGSDALCAGLSTGRRVAVRFVLLLVDALLLALLVVSILSIVSGSFSPVIYAAF